jgi:hypothetical protein
MSIDPINETFDNVIFNMNGKALFQKAKSGLRPINLSKGSEDSQKIISKIGQENFNEFLKTVKKTQNVIKDEKTGNSFYIVDLPDGTDLFSNFETEHVSWKDLRKVIKALQTNTHSNLTRLFAETFLDKAPILSKEVTPAKTFSTPIPETKTKPLAPSINSIECNKNAGAGDDNYVDIGGVRYAISIKMGNQSLSLELMSPDKRKEFIDAIKNATEAASSTVNVSAAEHIILNFKNNELISLSTKDTAGAPLSEVQASNEKLKPFATKLNACLLNFNHALIHADRDEITLRGMPRAIGGQSCWFGSALQAISQLMGHRLEEKYEELTKNEQAVPEYLQSLVTIKRRILGEEKGPIEQTTVKNLHAQLKALPLDPPIPDFNEQNDPNEFIDSLSNHLESALQIRVPKVEIAPGTDTISDKLKPQGDCTLPILENTSELNIFIQQNQDGTRSTQKIDVEKTIKVKDSDKNIHDFELVGAIFHSGTVQGGHYESYSTSNNQWFRLNDAHVEKVDEKTMLQNLSTNATQLIYRKLPQPVEAQKESVIKALHSTSKVDFDKWLDSSIVLDWTKKQADITPPQTTVITKPASSASSKPSLYEAGDHDPEQSLIDQIDNVKDGERAFIPLIQREPNDTSSRHFVGIVVDKTDPKNRKLEYFNSVGRPAPKTITDLVEKTKLNIEEVLDTNNKWQRDGYRCGYYVSRFFELRVSRSAEQIKALTGERHTSTTNIDDLRRRMKNQYNRFNLNYGFDLLPKK